MQGLRLVWPRASYVKDVAADARVEGAPAKMDAMSRGWDRTWLLLSYRYNHRVNRSGRVGPNLLRPKITARLQGPRCLWA